MEVSLNKKIAKLLREIANKFDADNSELSESEALYIVGLLSHEVLSKAQACKYVNLSRSRFDDKISKGILPKGKKRVGFKELIWYKDELDESIRKLKNIKV